MNPLIIEALITALAQAIPELVGLFTKSSATQSDVDAIMTKYGLDQAALTAAIAAAKAAGK
jgi:hypothetical protein